MRGAVRAAQTGIHNGNTDARKGNQKDAKNAKRSGHFRKDWARHEVHSLSTRRNGWERITRASPKISTPMPASAKHARAVPAGRSARAARTIPQPVSSNRNPAIFMAPQGPGIAGKCRARRVVYDYHNRCGYESKPARKVRRAVKLKMAMKIKAVSGSASKILMCLIETLRFTVCLCPRIVALATSPEGSNLPRQEENRWPKQPGPARPQPVRCKRP